MSRIQHGKVEESFTQRACAKTLRCAELRMFEGEKEGLQLWIILGT